MSKDLKPHRYAPIALSCGRAVGANCVHRRPMVLVTPTTGEHSSPLRHAKHYAVTVLARLAAYVER